MPRNEHPNPKLRNQGDMCVLSFRAKSAELQACLDIAGAIAKMLRAS